MRRAARRVLLEPAVDFGGEAAAGAPLNLRAVRRSWQAYALLSPIFILLTIFVYYPPILGLVRAFFRWRPGVPATFIGFSNFITYFTYAETPHELVNIVKLLAFGLFAGIVMPFRDG